MQRLRIDLEGWNKKKKEKEKEERGRPQNPENQTQVSILHEEEVITREANEGLEERDKKRKMEGSASGGISKRRNLEKLEGWGLRSILLENEVVQVVQEVRLQAARQKWDWKDLTGYLLVETKQNDRHRKRGE